MKPRAQNNRKGHALILFTGANNDIHSDRGKKCKESFFRRPAPEISLYTYTPDKIEIYCLM